MNDTSRMKIQNEKMLTQKSIKIPKGIFIKVILGQHLAGIAYRSPCTLLWFRVRGMIYHPAPTCARARKTLHSVFI